MKHDPQIEADLHPADRPLGRSLLRGWRRRCPNCGGGPVFDGYLTVRRSCAACGQDLHHHRADDMPAYLVILIVGHIVVGGMVSLEFGWHPPVWVHWAIWPVLTLALSLWLLPRVKAMVIALQWSWKMHGFGGDED